jgi:hypothetical protein
MGSQKMKKFLGITIVGSVVTGMLLSGALAVSSAPQPFAPSPAQAECDCSHLKALQTELRNATRLQQAFRNFGNRPEVRNENVSTSKNMLQIFAKGDARQGLEPVPDYKGPSEFDYVSWGDTQDPDQMHKYKSEVACRVADSARELLEAAKNASACAGIAAALEAHENWHQSFCVRIGYRPYLTMHGADRALEEVEAYGAQIAVLRAEIARVLNLKECKRYKATGIYGGVVCSLEKPFTLTMSHASGFQGHPQFTPDNSQGGSMVDNPVIAGVQWEDHGRYTVEEKSWGPDIVMRGTRCTELPTGRFCTPYTNLRIALLPLDTDECNK